jgi:hypothetical protein
MAVSGADIPHYRQGHRRFRSECFISAGLLLALACFYCVRDGHSCPSSPGTSTDLLVHPLALGPSPAPVILIQAPPPPVPRTRLARLTAFARYSPCGPSDTVLDFHWDVLAPTDPAAPAGTPAATAVIVLSADGPTLELAGAAAAALSAGQTYRVQVSARLRGFAGGPAAATAEAPLALALEPAAAIVAGGGRIVGRAERVVLDASASVDPNACTAFAFGALAPPPFGCPAGAVGLSFAWTCAVGPAGSASAAMNPCRLANRELLALPAAAVVEVDLKTLALTVPFPVDIALTVAAKGANGAPPGTATAVLRVVDADTVATASLRTVYANAQGVAYLAAANDDATFRWSLSPAAAAVAGGNAPVVDTSDRATFPAGASGPAFLVRLGTPWARANLTRGVTYRATVTVTLPTGTAAPATLWADFTPRAGPARGTCRLTGPGIMREYAAPVVVECGGWVAEEQPLSYSFALVDPAAASGGATGGAVEDGGMWTPWSITGR